MPYRIIDTTIATLVEAALLGIITGYQVTKAAVMAFTDADWSRFMGPQGFTVGLLLAVVVLWGNGVVRERNEAKRRDAEEKARDLRHAENMAASKQTADEMKALAVESMKVTMRVDHTLNALTEQIQKRPCQAMTFTTPQP